jgi:NAD(P)-dependent dehydrogenase (short-subunit alcohol dehydrogenase family)
LFFQSGYQLALAARNTDKFATLTAETSAKTFVCDATSTTDVQQLFASLQGESLQVVIYNPSRIVRGAIETVDVEQVRKAIDVTAFGSFIVAQQAAAAMLKAGQGGTILFTGASAGTKGFSKSAAFAMGKFAQRGLTESLSRKLHPQNIHVCWFNIDGGIANPSRSSPSTSAPDSMLDPAAIAQIYLAVVQQHRSAWSNEIALRPWVEKW